ncbi:hypothetical protein tinsulaeT_30760 [Thalassotalea insulae]|uniref:histidine kinase n=1 Tax=Thalassotalea insulae TaxID=2056778 RepID=A0ABQ6GUW4_9GAMM|nr:EAL domain-containing protein [Thalassotalea insulae]GLX79736.1 hypothetical protein tinsulaeT_30760 [Thalassotalea insulae]
MEITDKVSQFFLAKLSFRQQLALTFTVGILLLTVVSSIVTTRSSQQTVIKQFVQQGKKTSQNFAEHSKLALLYASEELAKEQVQAALGFPDIIGVTIYRKDGKALLSKGQAPKLQLSKQLMDLPSTEPVYFEDEHSWEFYAPVYSSNDSESEASPFASESPSSELIGFVALIQSKQSLNRISREITLTNMMTSGSLAIILLLGLIVITNSVTRPLKRLASNMRQAEQGSNKVRASLQGPKDIKHMEQAFNTMMDTLDRRQQELERARDSALASAAMKGQFVATVSHELRTPLNSILGMMEMVDDEDLSPKKHYYLNIARESGEHLLRLINDILDFSKLESSKMRLSFESFNLHSLLSDIGELMQLQLNSKHLLFGVRIDPAIPEHLIGDAGRIRQVIINLLGNAAKFTPVGCILVDISLQTMADDKIRLKVAVYDTGIGIEKSAQRLIFQAFSQADSSTTRLYGGSGLGLAISSHLVSIMGGEIGVESQLGQGSCFWFTVNLELTENINPPTANVTLEQLQTPLLVLEGSNSNLNESQALLEQGYSVHSAVNISKATHLLHQASDNGRPYRLILIFDSAMLADVKGFFRQVNEEKRFADPVVLVISAKWKQDDPCIIHHLYYLPSWLKPQQLGAVINHLMLAQLNKRKLPASSAEVKEMVALGEHEQTADLDNVSATVSSIMVVEDNRANQLVVTAMLEKLGHKPIIANHGKEALELLAKHQVALIFMDCHMPVMDGYETTSRIRAQQGVGQHIPIIAMTADAGSDDKKRCFNIGMDDFLLKPLFIKPLEQKLAHWLPSGKAKQRLEEPPVFVKEALPHIDSPQPLIDFNVLAQLKEETGVSFAKLVQAFLEDTPVTLKQLQEAIEQQDMGKIKAYSHLLKGSSATLGASQLSAIAHNIEHQLEDMDQEYMLSEYDELKLIYSRVKDKLIQELKSINFEQLVTDALSNSKISFTQEQPYILIVDDDRSTRLTLRASLEHDNYYLEEASDGNIALSMCQRKMPDLILMDAMMEEMNGFDAMKLILAIESESQPLIIIFTASDDDKMIEKAFECGATDFIPKPVNLHVMRRRVVHLIRTAQAEQHIHKLAYQDQLTNLPNRTLFMEKVNQAMEQATKGEHLLALMFLDLDKFKLINDTQGHDVGDMLLKAVAKRLCHCVRTGDLVVRLGGDEFTILLDNIPSPTVAARVAQKVCNAMREPFNFMKQPICVPVSIGISLFPADGENIRSLMKHADTAMYRAKAGGGDNFQFYEYGMEAELTRRMELERDLRLAMENNELILHYQPQISLTDGHVCGVEALVRWEHPERGLLPPSEFIPLAEESGVILSMGSWILNQSCQQFRQWQELGIDIKFIAVNISIYQLQHDDLLQQVNNCLTVHQLKPECLQLELTESILAEESEQNLNTMNQLRKIGVSLAIDDFGTGYSSLSYLTKFPFDTLKIDRTFVKNLPSDADGAAIASGIIALAHKLRMEVIAEGVEQEEQRNFLAQENCDFIQGYLNCRALPAEEFKTWYQSYNVNLTGANK